jgi:3-methylcrotonyl-CoA carboxylase beta subunit
MSGMGIPQISLVFGNSTAGGAYIPGLSDYTVFVRKQALAFLGGPPLVKMATGEEVDDETLGGTDMHARLSGLADYVAENDADAIRIGREIVGRLNWHKTIRAELQTPEPPLYDPDELLGIVPIDTIRKPLDMREVLARIVDGSRLMEFKRLWLDAGVRARPYQRVSGRLSPTTGFYSRTAPTKRPRSSNCATIRGRPCSTCKISPASWLGKI